MANYSYNATTETWHRNYNLDAHPTDYSGYTLDTQYPNYCGRVSSYYCTSFRFSTSLNNKTILSVLFEFDNTPARTTTKQIGILSSDTGCEKSGNVASYTPNEAKTYTIDMGTTVPTYGYVLGPNTNDRDAANSYVIITNAKLLVTTLDYSYTVTFDANLGTGSYNNLNEINDDASTTTYTFTIPTNYIPTRSGYQFLGWSTSQSAITALYIPGNSYAFNLGITDLYAVWKLLATVHIVNDLETGLDTYKVYIVENGALAPYRIAVVNNLGTLDFYN